MELIEIVDKLVGDYHAIGESYHDNRSEENLETYCKLTFQMVLNLFAEAELVECPEASRQYSGHLAIKQLKYIKDEIGYFLEDYEDKDTLK